MLAMMCGTSAWCQVEQELSKPMCARALLGMAGQEELQGYLTADLGSLVEAVLERQPQLLCPVRMIRTCHAAGRAVQVLHDRQ